MIGLQQELVIYINNLKSRTEVSKQASIPIEKLHIHLARATQIQTAIEDSSKAEAEELETSEDNTQDMILANCEEYLRQSKLERKKIARRSWEISKGLSKGKIHKTKKNHHTQTERIDKSELNRMKAAGKCQCCAWPKDQKGSYKTTDCFWGKRTENGTVPFPKKKQYGQKSDLGQYLSTNT